MLPYFAGEGSAALPGLWVGAPQGRGLPCSLLVQPQRHRYARGAAPSSLGLEAPRMRLAGTWCRQRICVTAETGAHQKYHCQNIVLFLACSCREVTISRPTSVCLSPFHKHHHLPPCISTNPKYFDRTGLGSNYICSSAGTSKGTATSQPETAAATRPYLASAQFSFLFPLQ